LELPNQRNAGLRFGTWNIRKCGLRTLLSRILIKHFRLNASAEYQLELSWCGTKERTHRIFSVEMETSIVKCGQASFIYKVITAIHRAKYIRQVKLRSEKLEGKYLEYLNADGRIILKFILKS
jgi:hypothetical protein